MTDRRDDRPDCGPSPGERGVDVAANSGDADAAAGEAGASDADPDEPPVRPDGGSLGAHPERPVEPSLSDRIRLRPGFLLGMAAFLGTYAVMYMLRAERVASAVAGIPFAISTSTPEIPQVVGWLVYRAHFVPIEYSFSGARSGSGVLSFGSFPGANDFVAALEPGLLLLVPLFMLVLGGFYTAIECDVSTPRTGAVAGASVAIGYLVLVVLAVVVMTWSISLSVFNLTLTASIGPGEVQAVFLAGVLYPLVGGALGGAAAGAVGDWSPS